MRLIILIPLISILCCNSNCKQNKKKQILRNNLINNDFILDYKYDLDSINKYSSIVDVFYQQKLRAQRFKGHIPFKVFFTLKPLPLNPLDS